jgi:hypothetical protein
MSACNRRSPTAGNRNHGSNWIRKSKRLRIYARDGWRCWCCGTDAREELTLDHIVARARGGTNHETNLITACYSCNTGKGDRSAVEWAFSYWGDRRGAAAAQLSRMVELLGKPLPPPPLQVAA